MSRAAYQARLRNAARARLALADQHGRCERTYSETRHLELEIALATHRDESYRAMARRLDCSHVYCWRVARRYRSGQNPMLPRNAQELSAMRDSLFTPPVSPAPVAQAQPPPEPPAYVIPEQYRDLAKWKEQYYAERPWLRKLRTS